MIGHHLGLHRGQRNVIEILIARKRFLAFLVRENWVIIPCKKRIGPILINYVCRKFLCLEAFFFFLKKFPPTDLQ